MTECNDNNCPVHGTISVRGRQLKGKVVSAKMKRSAIIRIRRVVKVPKYERYEKRTTRIAAHRPDCMQVAEGDTVVIGECRPLSKTKSFVILRKA